MLKIFKSYLSISLLIISPLLGNLNDAKKYNEEGKFQEAEKALEKELSKRSPSETVLLEAIKAAKGLGRPLSAYLRTNRLLKTGYKGDENFILEAARLSEMNGDSSLATSRYLSFIEVSNQKNETMRSVLAYLMEAGYSEGAFKYIKLFGHDQFLLEKSHALVRKLYDDNKTKSATKLLLELIKANIEKENNKELIQRLIVDIERNRGFNSAKQRVEVIKATKVTSRNGWIDGTLDAFVHELKENKPNELVAHFLDIQTTNNKALGSWLIHVTRDYIKRIPDGKEKSLLIEKWFPIAKEYAPKYYHYTELLVALNDISAPAQKVPAQELVQLFYRSEKDIKYGKSNHFIEHISRQVKDKTTLQTILSTQFDRLDGNGMRRFLESKKGEGALELINKRVANMPLRDSIHLKMSLLDVLFKYKKVSQSEAEKIIYEILSIEGPFLGRDRLEYYMSRKEFPLDTRLSFLKKLVEEFGLVQELNQVVKQLSKNKEINDHSVFKEIESLKGTKGTNPYSNFIVRLRHKKELKTITTEIKDYLNKHNESYPVSIDEAKSIAEIKMHNLMRWHISALESKRSQLKEVVLLWAGKIKTMGPDIDYLTHVLYHRGGREMVPFVKLIQKNEYWKNFRRKSEFIHETRHKKGDENSVFRDFYSQTQSRAIKYIVNQARVWSAKYYYEEVDALLKALKTKASHAEFNQLVSYSYWVYRYDCSDFTYEKLMGYHLKYYSHLLDYETEFRLLEIAYHSKLDYLNKLKSFFDKTKARSADKQLRIAAYILRNGHLSEDVSLYIVKDVIVPALEKLSISKYSKSYYERHTFKMLNVSKHKTEIEALVQGINKGIVSDFAYGEKFIPMAFDFIQKEIEAKNWDYVNRATLSYVNVIARIDNKYWSSNLDRFVKPLAELFRKNGLYENAYILLERVKHKKGKNEKTIWSDINRIQATVAQSIDGLIPVAKTDPMYDLYIASRALVNGNEEEAWEKTEPAKKLNLLIEKWESFDLNYVTWAIEKMRNTKKLELALGACQLILIKEFEIDPEVVARLSLIKGDVYTDQNNLQAARIEFEGLKNNIRYSKTKFGQMAKFRLVELMILNKDYANAEAQLERITDSGKLSDVAEAFYYNALIAFEGEDYNGAADYVKQVLKRDSQHAKALLLDAKLKLKITGGLRDTTVRIGDATLKKVVTPGKELVLTLQDQNLAIAQGGKAIPVVVSTTLGGDEEKVDLIPSASNQTAFTATIQTALGDVKKNNLLLEIRGGEQVQYVIDLEYQKANDLNYSPKILDIKSNALLISSSGKILSKEEQEQRELERRMNPYSREVTSKRLVVKSGTTVRPGSPIYIQVSDLDQDKSDEVDSIKVSVETTSGDIVDGYELKETDRHTGVFKGVLKTGLPLPKAIASDTADGSDPTSVINSAKSESWKSLSDGIAPKFISVDTMNSHQLSEAEIVLKNKEAVKKLSVYGSLEGDDILIANWPKNANLPQGGVTVRYFDSDHNTRNHTRMKSLVKRKEKSTHWNPMPEYNREDTDLKGRNYWLTVQMKGAFFIEQQKSYEFKVISEMSPHRWQSYFVFINGKRLNISHTRSERVFLKAGLHRIEILLTDHHAKSQFKIGVKNKNGDYEGLPSQWFSVEENPGLKQFFRFRGEIESSENKFSLKFSTEERFRKLKWVFDEFTSQDVEVESIRVTNKNNEKIIPVEEDYKVARLNDTLEIAPGDEIVVSYEDTERLKKENPVLKEELNASFYNATVNISKEDITQTENSEILNYYKARRCSLGDQLMIIVNDFDMDLTEEADTIECIVKTSSGEELKIKALENSHDPNGDKVHSGVFMATVIFGDATEGQTIKTKAGDVITIEYLDKENTKPGIPFVRSYSINVLAKGTPDLKVYKTQINLVEDNSTRAKAQKEKLKRKGIKEEDLKVYKKVISARDPSLVKNKGGESYISSEAPILFTVKYKEFAMHEASVYRAVLKSKSYSARAEENGEEAVHVEVPMYLNPLAQQAKAKGYDIQIEGEISSFVEDGLLDEGLFAGLAKLQVGSYGDPIDNSLENRGDIEFSQTNKMKGAFTIPTLLVAGADSILIVLKDKEDAIVLEKEIKLLSDGRLELMDSSYSVKKDSIHIGEKFYVRLSDMDQDKTDERDEITVQVKAASGSSLDLKLSETLPHSGIFTASFKPRIKAKAGQEAKTAEEMLAASEKTLDVIFGDEISFQYKDTHNTTKDEAIDVAVKGLVHKGADAKIVSFSKRFSDPEIAVKTRFLIAEALFEMAKDHRKLKKEELAEEGIARGKRILEEAMRDYPNTKLVAQGEFLLANLAQEMEKYQEALGRYSNVISHWPNSEFAPRSQFKKAICLEKMKKYSQSCEEYVKLIYIYPDSPLVADATVRLGNYYYKQKQFATSGRIFQNFQVKNSAHPMAPKALFLAAQSFIKMENFNEAIKTLDTLISSYEDEKKLRAEAMYWKGDSSVNNKDAVTAYRTFKQLTWDYPESKWAKIARGRLSEDMFINIEENN